MAKKNVPLRLEQETIDDLEIISKATERDASFLMRKAIEEYVSHEKWIVEETKLRWEKIKAGEAKLLSHDEARKELGRE